MDCTNATLNQSWKTGGKDLEFYPASAMVISILSQMLKMDTFAVAPYKLQLKRNHFVLFFAMASSICLQIMTPSWNWPLTQRSLVGHFRIEATYSTWFLGPTISNVSSRSLILKNKRANLTKQLQLLPVFFPHQQITTSKILMSVVNEGTSCRLIRRWNTISCRRK